MNEHEEKNSPEMTGFEQALARSLRHVEVKADLTKKFLALAEEAGQQRVAAGGGPRWIRLSNGGRVLAMPRPRMWFGGAVAAALVFAFFAGESVHRQHEQERARVNQQFEAAMRITDHALDKTEAQLERAGLKLGD